MKKVKILVVGRLFQSELAFLNAFKNIDFVFFDTYGYFSHQTEDNPDFFKDIDGVIVWDESQSLFQDAIAYSKPVIYRKFRGVICEETMEKALLKVEEKNLLVMVFETVEFDALYRYIKAQVPVFEADYGAILKIEAFLKAPFKPQVSNFVFEEEIGCVVDEYLRLFPLWFPKFYGFTDQYGPHKNHEHSKWGLPMFGDFRYIISADTDTSLSNRQIAFKMTTKSGFIISFSNHDQKLCVQKNGVELHSRSIPVENYFEVIKPQFELFFKEVLG